VPVSELPPSGDEILFHPDVVDEPEEESEVGVNQLYCFLDETRLCNAACVAWKTHPKESQRSELSEFQTHCVLLHNVERLGRNVTIAASALSSSVTREKTREADERRKAQFNPTSQTPTSPFPGGKP